MESYSKHDITYLAITVLHSLIGGLAFINRLPFVTLLQRRGKTAGRPRGSSAAV